MDIAKHIESMSDTQGILLAKAYQRECFNHSLALTARDLLDFKEINQRTHRGMIHALESETRRKLIVMPRGTFKSSIASVSYPIWLLNRNPNERILLDSELYTNSKNFLREIKEHLQKERLVSLYGQYRTQDCWNEGEIIVKQRTKVLKEASITASGIGSEKTGQHYDIIICDDLNSPNNSNTEDGRQNVLDHFRYLTSILEPNGTIVVVATRYHEVDCPGFILDTIIEPKKGLLDAS